MTLGKPESEGKAAGGAAAPNISQDNLDKPLADNKEKEGEDTPAFTDEAKQPEGNDPTEKMLQEAEQKVNLNLAQ